MREILREYGVPAGQFDEIHDDSGALRTRWAAFASATGAVGHDDLDAAQRRVTRQLHDNGVTYNLQAAGSPARPWTLDVLPHIVAADEWQLVAAGLRQRARLLEAIAADLYGSQRLLASGTIPPALVFWHRGFIRAAHGVRPPGGMHLHLLAFDLGRGADGVWRVLATRTQAPSGVGYALENRLTTARLFPDAFRDQRVQLLAPFFRTLQELLLVLAPARGETPHVVLLTPGRYNETYFEHAYLSRYLGFTLTEGADLTVRDDCVYLKTVDGLRRVHAILRRVDDDFCDPLELRAESALGVTGLLHAWRQGNVVVANAFGSGVLESPGLSAFFPAICSAILGESLVLPGTSAWWCAQAGVLGMARGRLAELVIKPVGDAISEETVIGGRLNVEEREAWLDRLRTWPERYVIQEFMPLAHVPVWSENGLESRALMMRVFLAANGAGDYHVLPGGLARIGGTDHEVVSGQRGGGSKDVWVLSDTPVEPFSLLPGRLRPSDIAGSERAVSSRAAEHLFWMGRYAERSENAARLLRAVLSRLPQRDLSVSASSPAVVATCRRLELLPASADVVGESGQEYERILIGGITRREDTRSLAFNVAETLRVAGAVRDRLSSDNWRTLNRLAQTLEERSRRAVPLADALEVLDHAIMSLVAVGGLEMAHMTRDDGWRFMSLGRHLERLLYVIGTTAEVAQSPMVEDPALLDWLLDLSDSIITYRARYMGHAEWLAVADLVLFDRRNPRSAAFQLSKLAKHVPQLPGGDLEPVSVRLAQAAAIQESPAILEHLSSVEQLAIQLSDQMTLRYFSHVYEPAHATLLQ